MSNSFGFGGHNVCLAFGRYWSVPGTLRATAGRGEDGEMASPKIYVKACINGARTPDQHPHLPVTPEQLASEAVAAHRAGALAEAADCLEEAIAIRLIEGEDIPAPSPRRAGRRAWNW